MLAHARLGSGLVALWGVVCVTPVGAQGWVEADVLTVSNDVLLGDYLGLAVAIRGDTAVVGAPLDDENGWNRGAAYVFRRPPGGTSWSLRHKLLASDGGFLDWFGTALAISEDEQTIAVGARGNNYGRGAVFLFGRDHGGPGTWHEFTKLTASDGGLNFGTSVSLWGDTLLVGAPAWSTNYLGSAYVFEQDHGGLGAWGELQILLASDGANGQQFGTAVAIEGDTAVIGARNDDDQGYRSGSAYVFTRPSGGILWNEAQKLTAVEGEVYHWFGSSVDMEGEVIVVGAPVYKWGSSDPGAAYVFERVAGAASWSQVASLQSTTPSPSSDFGASVAIWGDRLIVGDPYDDFDGEDAGAAHVFARSPGVGWGLEARLSASDAFTDDWFGTSVAIWGDTALCGANGADSYWADYVGGLWRPGTQDAGAAYAFQGASVPSSR